MATGILGNKTIRRLGGKTLAALHVDIASYYTRRARMSARKWIRSKSIRADVAVRDGWFIFHDPGNTLIRRGPFYEPESREALFALCAIDSLRGGLTQIADIGANIGLHTALIARRFPSVTIHAYDPSPQSILYLRETIEYNGLKQVHLHECALGAESGEMEFYTWGSESSADSLRDTERVSGGLKATKISVAVKTLDQQSEEGVRPTVIKMDCEGGELDVLRGGAKVFDTYRPLVLTEFSSYNIGAFGVTAQDLLDWARRHRYKIFTLGFSPVESCQAIADEQGSGEENFILLPEELSRQAT